MDGIHLQFSPGFDCIHVLNVLNAKPRLRTERSLQAASKFARSNHVRKATWPIVNDLRVKLIARLLYSLIAGVWDCQASAELVVCHHIRKWTRCEFPEVLGFSVYKMSTGIVGFENSQVHPIKSKGREMRYIGFPDRLGAGRGKSKT